MDKLSYTNYISNLAIKIQNTTLWNISISRKILRTFKAHEN